MQFVVGSFLFFPLISALVFVTLRATDAIELHQQSWSPRPTDPPTFNKELLKRQSDSFLTQIEGPDTICGYQFGSQNGALGLCYTSTCGFATGMGEGEIYCYDSTTSAPRPRWTECLGGTLAISCLADSACSNNLGIGLCMVSTEPYCNVGTFVGLGIEAVWCDSTYYAGGSTVPIYTTYSGQLGRVFTNPTSGAEVSTTTSIPSPLSSTSTTTQTSSSTVSTPSISPTNPTYIPQSKSTPVGHIVGGVIGGLALIALIAASIFFCLRRNRNNKQTTNIHEMQSYAQTNNTNSQQPSEKYPPTTKTTFIPAGYPPVQPSYNVYPIPQQPIQQPVQQTQHHYPQNFQAQPYPPLVQPQPQSSPQDAHRGSMATSILAPGSPTPPSYMSQMPDVPEMTGEARYTSPTGDRHEMSM
jgi:hypothetical protein